MIHEHSMLAYDAIKSTLNEKQRMVLDVYETDDYTDEEVANILGWTINRVCGRIGELVRMNRLHEVGARTNNLGRKVRVCGLPRINTLF